MTLIVKTVTRIVAEFITIFAVYLIVQGHLTPGGGFVGGVILACAFVLVTLAFGKDFAQRILSHRAARWWDSLGALGFLAVALAGYFAGAFFVNTLARPGNFRLLSGGIIPLCNIAIGVKVGACLFSVFLVLVMFRTGGGGAEEGQED